MATHNSVAFAQDVVPILFIEQFPCRAGLRLQLLSGGEVRNAPAGYVSACNQLSTPVYRFPCRLSLKAKESVPRSADLFLAEYVLLLGWRPRFALKAGLSVWQSRLSMQNSSSTATANSLVADGPTTLLEGPAKPLAAFEVRSRRILGTIFSFPVVRVVLLVMMAVFTVSGRFNAPDTWWDLKTGEIIWNTHHIPTTDTFSFTTNNHTVVPHEWLAQLSIYAVYHLGGYVGMAAWLGVFSSLLLIAAYALCWLYSGSAKAAFLGAFGTWFFATVGFSIRAQLIGYFFLVCELLIIWLGRARNRKWFLLLPPLFVLWVNCHGSFLLGLVVLGVTLGCSFLEFRTGLLVSHRWTSQQRNMLAAALLFSMAGLFVNPAGLTQVTYPINTMFSQKVALAMTTEWQPAPFDDPRAWGLLAIAGLILLVPMFRCVELTLQEILLVGLGFEVAIQHERMVFVFGILAMPVFCRLIATAWNRRGMNRNRGLLNAVVITMATWMTVQRFPGSREITKQVNKANPVKAVEFIRRAGLSGRMLNDYNYGGYLIWAAPERKVFADARADVYEWTGVLKDYMKFSVLRQDPRVLLDKYRIDYCLLNRDTPISRMMQLLPGWKSIYSDDMSIVFVRSTSSAIRK